MTALTIEELMAWVDRTTDGWRALVAKHPEALLFACDIRETHSVAELLQHIVAVELRYAERLNTLPETPYEAIPTQPGDTIFATHEKANALLYRVLPNSASWWEEPITFATRSAGTMQKRRRTVLVHLLMHSIRHYAQLATLARTHGVMPGWSMDYLFMDTTPS